MATDGAGEAAGVASGVEMALGVGEAQIDPAIALLDPAVMAALAAKLDQCAAVRKAFRCGSASFAAKMSKACSAPNRLSQTNLANGSAKVQMILWRLYCVLHFSSNFQVF